MWDKARSLAARHLKDSFVNLGIVSTEDQNMNQTEAVADPPVEVPQGDLTVAVANLNAQCDQLKAEVADLQDRLLRRQAEFENFRRRTERDRNEFLEYAGMEVVRELLPVLDDFERARKTSCSDPTYQKGIDLIYQSLVDALKKLGLDPIEIAPGTEFDPNLHQAMVRQDTKDAPDNTVLEQFQRGYNFKGKLLRPAMVKVAVRPS
jgi:molecular chaperone GrpE